MTCGDRGETTEHASMTPVKEMALSQALQIAGAQAGAAIEQTIADVDGPCAKRDEERNPGWQMHFGGARESECPDNSDGWCIEARQVPEAKDCRGFDEAKGLTKLRGVWFSACGLARGSGTFSIVDGHRGRVGAGCVCVAIGVEDRLNLREGIFHERLES